MIGTLLNDRFALEAELGRGGMGAVYRATDQLLGRSVAIKVLKDLTGEEVKRKIRLEAQILARLLHDNVVRLYDFGISGGTYFLVMEEVDGSSFQKRWRKLEVSQRLRVLAQVSDALDYAHHQGVIHRDVKPGNILLTSGGQAKLSDFGLSLIADQDQETGITRGTPHYMSPEQARGRKLDHRSDLYALGVILYECTTGITPFQGSISAVMSQHISQVPERPRLKNRAISPDLEELIMHLLAKDPAERPASGRVVAEALRSLVQEDAWKAPAESAVTRASPLPPAPAAPAPGPAAIPEGVAPQVPAGPSFTTRLPGVAMSLSRAMIDAVEADPIILSPDERYLFGHYLAYLLGGSRKQGFFRRRPHDQRNADRARFLLAMAYLTATGGGDEAIGTAAALLESYEDVRPGLSPIAVAKYLAARGTDAKRKRFRAARKRLQEASAYAQNYLLDGRGSLNPGLMPQTIDDLHRLAPARSDVDDQLVERWNRLTDIWRGNYRFRQSVLRYATQRAHRDPASYTMWPEVVYPLIERARWQRRRRSRLEAFWDAVCGNLHLPVADAGLQLDQAFSSAVPVQVVAKLDMVVDQFQEEAQVEEEADTLAREAERLSIGTGAESVNFEELAADEPARQRGLVRLANPDPFRLSLNDLAALWRDAIANLKSAGTRVVHRPVPLGPYRLVVIPSIRGHQAGTIAIQGMPNKQIEMLTPPLRAASSARPAVAVWLYRNNSLVIAYVDFKNNPRFILWDAAINQQTNFDEAATLHHDLLQLGLEVPDQVDRVLTNRFQPRNPV